MRQRTKKPEETATLDEHGLESVPMVLSLFINQRNRPKS